MKRENIKSRNIHLILFSFLLLLCAFVFTNCFSDLMEEGKGNLTINFGDNHKRSIYHISPDENDDEFKALLSKMTYNIVLTGNGAEIRLSSKGGKSVKTTVPSGFWDISVRAYAGNILYGEGFESFEVITGEKNTVTVQMKQAVYIEISPVDPEVIADTLPDNIYFEAVLYGYANSQNITWAVTGSESDDTAMSSNGSSATLYIGGDEPNGKIKVYAFYKDDPSRFGESIVTIRDRETYTVRFESNGGTQVSDNSVGEGSPVTEPTPAPTKTGYTLEGWYTDTNLNFPWDFTYIVDYTMTNNKIFTLYAKWEPITYTIVFDGNDTAVSGNMTSLDNIIYDDDVTLPENTFTLANNTFIGWNTVSDGSGTSFNDGAIVRNLSDTQDDPVTLYAQWKKDQYTITFNGNGATSGNNYYTIVDYDAIVAFPAQENFLNSNSRGFGGWYIVDANGDVTRYNEGVPIPFTRDITVYVDWEYWVGDTGPAGGIIFHVAGPTNPKWRYLEAAPADHLDGFITSGYDLTMIQFYTSDGIDDEYDGFLSIGFGKDNTIEIIEEPLSYTPAYLCENYSVTYNAVSYADWFLPSIGELELMYNSGNFFAKDNGTYYWSSSLDGYPWIYQFYDNSVFDGRAQRESFLYGTSLVRPVRRF